MDHKIIFNQIYSQNLWKNGSGLGSTPDNTIHYRWFIRNFIITNKIKSVVDIGCGDWQFSKLIDWQGVHYLGVDVSDVVLSNTRKFSSPGIEFLEINAVEDDLPSADLVIAKDVIQHWSNDDIIKFIPKLRNFERALITNGFHPNFLNSINKDILTGNWRPVDLTSPPFNLRGSYVFWYFGGEPKHIFY